MQKRAFLKNMNYLRGFAIFCIMSVHIWWVPAESVEPHSIYLKLISVARELLFHDSTIFFIFISGFLFEYLSSKYSISEYYKSKFKNVFIPYIVLSTIILTYQLLVNDSDFMLNNFFSIILMGEAQFQYWYIPFICVVFIISPLLLKIPKEKLRALVPLLILMSLLGTRTGITISLGQYLYFLPIYILGIICSANYDRFIIAIEKRLMLIFISIIISTCLIIFAKIFDFKFLFINFYESFHYLQKMFILLFLIIFFKRIEHLNIKILDLLAKYSFALFFIHTLINSLIVEKFYNQFATSTFLLIPLSLFYTLMIISITLLLCMLMKKLLGKNSRYIIGV